MAIIVGGLAAVETTPTPNAVSFESRVITVPTAGTPVQLPTIAIGDSFAVTVRAHVGNGTSARVIYLANSSANALDATKRITLERGQSVQLTVTNVNSIWIDASVNGLKAEVLVEQ